MNSQLQKIKTNPSMNEERWRMDEERWRMIMKSITEMLRKCYRSIFSSSFSFFSPISLWTSQYQVLSPSPQPPSCLFIGNEGRRLHSSSPRRAGYFKPKLSGGLGEPKASLGEPGAWKSYQMTIFPSLLGIFRILFWNVRKPYVLHDNRC